MPSKAKFRIANYDGGLKAHDHKERKGKLVLPSRMPPTWRLWLGLGRGITGGLTRFPIEVHATGPSSCRAVIRDIRDASVAGSFDLPDTPASDLKEALRERESLAVVRNRQRLASDRKRAAADAPAKAPRRHGRGHVTDRANAPPRP